MSRSSPVRPLLHPLWWAALALLVVNDHALKGAGVLPGIVTGKLSDVAGLVVAPWVLAALLRATTMRLVLLAHALVGAGFAAINLWPACARLVEAWSAFTPMPWRITVDPTDVLALPALALSFVVLGAVARGPDDVDALAATRVSWRRAGRGVAFAAGLLACVATSREPPPWQPTLWGSLFVVSTVDDTRVITTRTLSSDVQLDCTYVSEDPSSRLPQELFAPVVSWELPAGEVLPLPVEEPRACDALLVGGGGAAPVLLFWNGGELPAQGGIEREALLQDPLRAIRLEPVEGGGARFGDHAFRHPAPALSPPLPDESCRAPAPGRVAWSEQAPEGSFVLDGVLTSPDGCHALDLLDGEDARRLFLCLDGAALPFAPGETLVVEATAAFGSERLALTGDSLVLAAVRGGTLASDATVVEPTPVAGCAPTPQRCGTLSLPASLRVVDDGEEVPLERGVATTLSSGVRLHLASAIVSPVRDASCDPTPSYFESFSLSERE